MERKHGYSLSSFVDLTEEGEDKLFDLCETFMTTPDCDKLENDEWQILREEDAQIELMYKPTNIHYTVHVDENKYMEEIWKSIAEEDKKYYTNVKRVNNRILRAIKSVKGKVFAKELLSVIKESEGVVGPWKIVKKPKGGYQDEDYGTIIKGWWVDQWRNGGYEGDDFAGDIYIKLKKDKYLKIYYSC